MENLPQEKFEFIQNDEKIFDQKLETKRIGYFKDAFIRFRKNKGSIIAGVILLMMILFAIIVPATARYDINESDAFYRYALPKNNLVANTGWWDGCETKELSETQLYIATHTGTKYGTPSSTDITQGGKVQKVLSSRMVTNPDTGNTSRYYTVTMDTYVAGFAYRTINNAQELENIRAYEQESGRTILYPLIDLSWIDRTSNNGDTLYSIYQGSANYSYKMNIRYVPEFDENNNLQYLYKKDAQGNYIYTESSETGGTIRVRVDYDEYYVYLHGSAPEFILGSDASGRDIFARLGSGARLSLILGFTVAFCNIILGVIYGSIEGYYGGTTDLVMERISEILVEVPFMIVVTLFQMHFANKVGVIPTLFLAFIVTGWIGTAARVRMQFYRYKGQEYVLAARTLGAKDSRLIMRHILPNAIGPIITGSVLMIPGVIFSESSLTYLNIIDLQSSPFTSIGAMLSDGQSSYTSYPNVILWPALFISLLMICFNVFGNGLRDAFNPSLRGAE